MQLFTGKGGTDDENAFYQNKDMPVLHAWHFFNTPLGEGSGMQAIAERNPYYWKVDPEGNQLPYLDRIVFTLTSDAEVTLLQALNGEVDLMDQVICTAANKPVLYQNQEKGGYHFFTTTPTLTNTAMIQLNMNHPDPVKREVFQNKNFRIGLSHAINRQEIIDIVFAGQGEPHQGAPRPDANVYHEKLSKQYTEYDPDLANEYLNKAGYTERDSEGYRLGPDGKRISMVFEIDAVRLTFIDMLELIPGYWKKVGIEAVSKTMDRNLWSQRVRNGYEFDATIHRFGGGSSITSLTDPRYYFPLNNNSMYAKKWAAWYMNPDAEMAEEPPAETKKQMELYDQLLITSDPEGQKALMKEILDIAADQFYAIGISTEPNNYGIVTNNFKNVPESMPWSWDYPHPAPDNPFQFFKE